jgi:hypothetical protein
VVTGAVDLATAFAANETAGQREMWGFGGLLSVPLDAVLFARPDVGAGLASPGEHHDRQPALTPCAGRGGHIVITAPSCCDRCGRWHLPTAPCVSEPALDIFAATGGEGQDTVDGLEEVAVACYVFSRPLGIRPCGCPRSRQNQCDVAGAAPLSSDMLGCVVMSAAATAAVALLGIILVGLHLFIG